MAPKGGGGGKGGGSSSGSGIDWSNFDTQYIAAIADGILLVFLISYLVSYFKLVKAFSPIIWSTFFLIGTMALDIPSIVFSVSFGFPKGWAIAIAFADTFYVFTTQLALMAIYDVYSKGLKQRVVKLAWWGWWGISWLVGLLYILLHFIYSGISVSIQNGGGGTSNSKYRVFTAIQGALSRVWTAYSIFVLLSLVLLWVLAVKSRHALAKKEKTSVIFAAHLSLFLVWLINVVHSEVIKRLNTRSFIGSEIHTWNIARACINAFFYIVFFAAMHTCYKYQHDVANGKIAQPIPQKDEHDTPHAAPIFAGQNTYYQPQTNPNQQYTYPAPQSGQYAPVPQQTYQQQPQQQYGVPVAH